MSTKVLVIPEDPKYNGYILKPIMERVLAEAGRKNAQVTVLPRSKLNGITNAKEAIKCGLLDAWKWADLWLFAPDGDRTNAQTLQVLEAQTASKGVTLIGCAAAPEVEAWMLAGHRHNIPVDWSKVAQHPRFKEEVFEPFMARHGFPNLPGGGREKLTKTTLSHYSALKRLCPEIAELEARLRQHFSKL